MSNWAIVNNNTNIVDYIVGADVPPYTRGCYSINVDGQPQVQIGWSYDPATGVFSPPSS